MIKLPSEVQSRISAASITSFTRAIEELVYNSIDAKATSIAVRVHIKNSFIQVIDNGHGISKNNIKYVGQQYTTTKYDKSDAFAVTKHYGYKGQALASLIKISEELNITSRCQSSENTWTKSFCGSKGIQLTKTNTRPSIGTTVEIKGFLYNLKIRKKSINEFNELNKIKSFMTKLLLVHRNISISLRDNSTNEIIFKAPKQRDIYQTLNSFCGVAKQDVKELKIEKKEYKVKAFISDKLNNYKWIYLNNRFISNARIKSIVDDEIKKHYHDNKRNKVKLKNNLNIECINERSNHLSYFLFIECPYEEYDFSMTPKQSLLEFRNWENITKLLEKLIQFYFGQLKVKEINKAKSVTTKRQKEDTRKEVKNIVQRVLGSLSKKHKLSPVINRVKGKLINRKVKKRPIKAGVKSPEKHIGESKIISLHNSKSGGLIAKPEVKLQQKANENDLKKNIILSKPEKLIKKRQRKHIYNKMATKFQDENSFIKRRCNELAANVDQLLALYRKEKQHVKVNRTVQLSNIVKDNKHYTVKKHIEEITVETTKFKNDNFKCRYDEDEDTGLPKTITDIEQSPMNKIFETSLLKNANYDLASLEFLTYLSHLRVPVQTFDSHEVNHYNSDYFSHFFCNNPRNFITKDSMDNFDVCKSTQHLNLPETLAYNNRKLNTKRYFVNYDAAMGSSGAITSFNSNMNRIHVINTYDLLEHNAVDLPINTNTYTMNPIQFSDKSAKTTKITKAISRNYDSMVMDGTLTNELNRFNTSVTNMDISDRIGDKTLPEAERITKNTYTLSTPMFSLDTKKCMEYSCQQEQNSTFEQFNDNVLKSNVLCSTSHTKDIEVETDTPKCDGYFRDSSEDIIVSEEILDKSNIILDKPQNNTIMKNVDELASKLHNLNINETNLDSLNLDSIFEKTFNNEKSEEGVTASAFQFVDRNKLLPKGMSPMYCNKTATNNLRECPHENSVFVDQHIFDDFITNVQRDMKIYEPKVQNMKEFSTVDVFKFKNKVQKDNDSLIFDSQSLKTAVVLGQVDEKFIAVEMKGKCYHSTDTANYLVLFDQHAVHERIRLENNLFDYLFEDQWNSIDIDSISLKFSYEELLYISNYSVKFKQFGLRWRVINNNEISINGIPKAILGKNIRSVDKIIVAVKRLILELVDSMSAQGGAISLYPKAIMELVFSEACRYAIKFGERLSEETCVKLLRELALCKVPFQCAHGRPVMAVLLEIEQEIPPPYSLDLHKIMKFKKNLV